MRRIAGNFKTTDQSVEVSDKAYSFLLITYERKNGQEWTSEQKENADHGPILRESKTINKLINKALDEWKNENKQFVGSYETKLTFRWVNASSSTEDDGPLESDLIGRHDYFRLLESPWIPELGNVVEKIGQKLEGDKKICTKELIGIPCVAADFKTEGKYFVGKGRPWFNQRDSHPIELDSAQVHALMFIDLKRGLRGNDGKLGLLDFLNVLAYQEIESGTLPQYCLRPETKKFIKGFFLGYGIYELIFLLESPHLEDLFVSVVNIRQCFNRNVENSNDAILARATSTMVFMPKKVAEKKKEKKKIKYSILVSTETGRDIEVTKEIDACGKQMHIKFDILNRQGYYDLIVSFEESSFFRVCKLIQSIRELPGVLGTSTIIKIDEKKIAKRCGGN